MVGAIAPSAFIDAPQVLQKVAVSILLFPQLVQNMVSPGLARKSARYK
jgi:hypothetical protein